ncbi:MFS transporter [Arthrobacter sp. NEB 688]|uniref:MFS transporter n=1 Tax=Arthrobacter sp. NEB 688 TaxID=904039 RepID=UPI00156471FB|nr:MFS transporter [Arthrobacter sp. NEB 688]QKE84491.1 MFS transporter [Arthrobacter sp. NEB 688]
MSTTVAPHRARRSGPWWVGTVAGMASYIDAAAITSISTALVILQTTMGLSDLQVGVAAGIQAASIALGAAVGGRIGDRFGRRPVFLTAMASIAAGMTGIAFAPGFPLLVVGIVVVGVAIGADLPVSLATIAEAADDDNRGRLMGFSNLLWLAGIVGNGVVAFLVGDSGRAGARILFLHVAVVAAVVLVLRLSIPESARWLAARAERARGVHTVRAERAGVRDLLRTPYAVPFVALVVFSSCTNLVGNTVGQFSTYLLVTYGGESVSTAALVSLPALPVVLVGMLWFMKIADRPVRFRYFQVGAFFFVASPLVNAFFGVSAVPMMVAVVLNAVGASFAFEGIARVWTQEQFPTLLRSTATGSIMAVARIGAALLAVVTPTLVAGVGVRTFYLGLGAACAVGLAVAWVVFRTRDRIDAFADEALAAPVLEQTTAPVV